MRDDVGIAVTPKGCRLRELDSSEAERTVRAGVERVHVETLTDADGHRDALIATR
jgi:hypothetical protein